MQNTSLREMLSLVNAKYEPYREVDGPYSRYAGPNSQFIVHRETISIARNPGFTLSDVAKALIEDIKEGHFTAYQKLLLILNGERECYKQQLPFNGVYQGTQTLKDLDVISGGIDGNPINNIRLYENSRSVVFKYHGLDHGSWDVDTFFGMERDKDNGEIWLTTKTMSEHISPFVNGEIDTNHILILYNNKVRLFLRENRLLEH